MNDEKTQKANAFKCNNGGNFWVCHDCAVKYSKQPVISGTTYYNNTCYICDEIKMVGPSRKLFGLSVTI